MSFIEMQDLFLEFGDIEAATETMHKRNNAICSEIGGCNLTGSYF